MEKIKKVIELIKPLTSSSNVKSFEELKLQLKSIPKYTMLTMDFFEAALNELPGYNILREGAWVEIGVWKGGGALFFKALINDLGIKQNLYLYDTFGKIPTRNFCHAKDLEFVSHFGISDHKMFEEVYKDEVEEMFKENGLYEDVYFNTCNIEEFSPSEIPNGIAFLHLDVDFYEPTLSALNLFYDKILPGGIVIIDDYYMELLNCKEAVDYFFEQRGIDLKTCGSQFSSYSIQIIKP